MVADDASRDQLTLVLALKAGWEAAGHAVQFFETHISRVLVCETFACKFKKPVRLDFLDFSTLAGRRHFCEEELRLNRRLAPGLYLDVVPVCGSVRQPVLGGQGEAIEFALRMRAFRQQDLWTHRLLAGVLGTDEVDDLAHLLAGFHRRAAVAPADCSWGTPPVMHAVAEDNYARLTDFAAALANPERVTAMRREEARQRARLDALFSQRKAGGSVRECHGDLHAGNILTRDGLVMAFDCIEFNETMRWIDVMNDIAFVAMDLHCRGRADLAARFLSQYLEDSGDYDGLPVLDYYQRHRALIRCKVALIRAAQLPSGSDDGMACRREAERYLSFAIALEEAGTPALMITHGFAGSGKSTLAGRLVGVTGALRIRSDVERKRLPRKPSVPPPGGGLAAGLYDPAVTEATYARLAELARLALTAGRAVIIDATFLRRTHRQAFAALAAELKTPFIILAAHADPARLRERIARRIRQGGDPSDADLDVLDYQLAHAEPLTNEERRRAIDFCMDAGIEEGAVEELTARLRQRKT